MARLVMKFGGTSVADIDRIRNVARHVRREVNAGHRGGGRRLRHGGRDERARQALPLRRRPARCPRIRRRRLLRRAGDGRAARHRAAGDGHQRALLARLADPDLDRFRAWRRAHHRYPRRRAPGAPGAGAGGGDRRLSGACPEQPHRDARARRVGYERGGDRRGDRGGALRHLYRRGRRLHDRSAHRSDGAAARQGRLRGNARNGLARLEGAAGALGRARHGARGQDLRALLIRRPGRGRTPTRTAIRSAHSFATRTRSWKSSS